MLISMRTNPVLIPSPRVNAAGFNFAEIFLSTSNWCCTKRE